MKELYPKYSYNENKIINMPGIAKKKKKLQGEIQKTVNN